MNFNETRKDNLLENIKRQYKLLQDYETRRDLSDRPKEIELANIEIKAITNSLEDYIGQYDRICQDKGEPRRPEITLIWNEIQDIKQGQHQIIKKQAEALAAIDNLRYEISMKIEASYRGLSLRLLSALNEQETRIAGMIIEEIDANQLSEQEISAALNAIQTGYEELRAKSLPLAGPIAVKDEVKELPQIWNSPDVNVGGKLKLSIPLIPPILSYETELSFSVKQTLSTLWGRYFKGKQVLI